MRKWVAFFFVSVLFTGCTGVLDKPENLVSKDLMAEVLAEMAVNDQTLIINPKGNIESGTRFILDQKKVKAKDFVDSYQYYSVSGKMEAILEDAEEIILEKDPKAEQYIMKKLKESEEVPAFAR